MELMNGSVSGVETYTKRKSMGIGPLGNPENHFVRKFRFTLESKECKNLELFVVYAKVNYTKNLLQFQVYEVVHPTEDYAFNVANWITLLTTKEIEDVLTLTTYTGCGLPIYGITFKGLEVLDHRMGFDYNSKDVSVQKVTLRFDTAVREGLLKPEENNATINTSIKTDDKQ